MKEIKSRNPIAKNMRVNKPKVFKPKKGKGSFSRKGGQLDRPYYFVPD